jgi:flagellar basal body rod protein FlgG
MIKGLYSAASAMIVGINRQKVLAHNAANTNTAGFKEILTSMQDYEHTSVVYPQDNFTGARQSYIGRLGLGVQSGPDVTNYSDGAIQTTENPYDFAINGAGFFRIKTAEGERYTRDGRFVRDAKNQLVTIDGNQVLDKNGAAITLPEGNIEVSLDGTISVNGATAGQIGLVSFKDPAASLVRGENNYFSSTKAPDGTTTGQIEQSALESSNVDTASLMTQMVSVARAYEAAQQMVQVQDSLLGKSINTLGNI